MKFNLVTVKVFHDSQSKQEPQDVTYRVRDSKFTACKNMSDSQGLMDFAVGLVDYVLCFEYSFNFMIINPVRKNKKICLYQRGGSS